MFQQNYCSVCGKSLHGFVRCMCESRKHTLKVDITSILKENNKTTPVDNDMTPVVILQREVKKLNSELHKLSDEFTEKERQRNNLEDAIKLLKDKEELNK